MDINEKIKLTVKLTETCHTFKQIADEFYRRTGYGITQPTVGVYLKLAWGDEYSSKKEDMREKYVKKKRLARSVMTEAKRREEWDKMVEETRNLSYDE